MREVNLSRNFERLSKARRQVHSDGWVARSARGVSYSIIKYAIDVLLAGLGLLILGPLILIVVVLLMVVQGRPVFITQPRVGKNGVMFPCMKFRTMVPNADQVLDRHLAVNPDMHVEWRNLHKLRNDPRITPMGAVLRRSSVDEIPQLVNVIRGEMSLVGPRPIVSSEIELYGIHFADYLKVRPGMTGLWQISGRSDTSYSERIQLDVRYVREQSILGDISIMIRTIPAVLCSRGSY